MSIQRYNTELASTLDGNPYAMMLPNDYGRFVTYADHIAEVEKVRDSVRRLVDEWRKKQQRESDEGRLHIHEADNNLTEIYWGKSDIFKSCADQLSALIDKEPTPPQTEGREG